MISVAAQPKPSYFLQHRQRVTTIPVNPGQVGKSRSENPRRLVDIPAARSMVEIFRNRATSCRVV
jgi:predicted CoA-binding protein